MIETCEALDALPGGVVVIDDDGDVARKRYAGGGYVWQVLDHDRTWDGDVDLSESSFLTLPVLVLWPEGVAE